MLPHLRPSKSLFLPQNRFGKTFSITSMYQRMVHFQIFFCFGLTYSFKFLLQNILFVIRSNIWEFIGYRVSESNIYKQFLEKNTTKNIHLLLLPKLIPISIKRQLCLLVLQYKIWHYFSSAQFTTIIFHLK